MNAVRGGEKKGEWGGVKGGKRREGMQGDEGN